MSWEHIVTAKAFDHGDAAISVCVFNNVKQFAGFELVVSVPAPP